MNYIIAMLLLVSCMSTHNHLLNFARFRARWTPKIANKNIPTQWLNVRLKGRLLGAFFLNASEPVKILSGTSERPPSSSSGTSASVTWAASSWIAIFVRASLWVRLFFRSRNFKWPKMSRGGTRVYFGRLPRDTRERDLERFVRGFGRVREVSIKLGYGFVVS